uniref:Uncharacterized protein n=1 Tax=Pseudomonas phage Touem01 TaxID=3138548 RepID=A0AAU6W1Z7_9VIRU
MMRLLRLRPLFRVTESGLRSRDKPLVSRYLYAKAVRNVTQGCAAEGETSHAKPS